MGDFTGKLQLLPIILPVLIGSLVLHELAHAWVATWLGDRTPRVQGRLTLNPIKHLDPWGSTMFLVTFLFFAFPFGWARPVQVSTRNLRNPQRGMALVAVAGPIVNFLIALGVLAVAVYALGSALAISGQLYFTGEGYWDQVVYYTIYANVVLGVFNLLPIPPLDGSRIVAIFMPRRMYEDWSKLDEYAPLFILAIFFFLQKPVFGIIEDATGRVLQAMVLVIGG